MASLNKTMIIGNVGKDMDFKFTQSGIAVASFSVAVTEKFGGKDGAEKQEVTTWYKVTAWRNLAEICNTLQIKKGQQVFVEGKVKVSVYMDKSGQPAGNLELTADTIQLLGSRNGDTNGNAGTDTTPYAAPDNMADIPF